MKLTAIILLSACLSSSATGNAQNVSISVKDASIEQVFKEIEKQTSYTFLYENRILEKVEKVTIDLKNVSLQAALAECLKKLPLSYKIFDNNTIVIAAKETKNSNDPPNDKENLSPPLIDITGRVTDEDGNPLVGATVAVKGTKIATRTDADGLFGLKAIAENAELIVSYAEHENATVLVGNRNFITVVLIRINKDLQEVIVNKGYYTENQKVSTSNVSTIRAKDIERQPVNNPLLALVGRVPGVTIEQQTGFANSGVVVRVQGTSSITGGLDPLYVIDGVPYISQPFPTQAAAVNILGTSGTGIGGGNPLNYINPSDIESIDILKDADATAIYGSRGANGVILITMKKGKPGQTKFNLSIRSGWAKAANKVDLLNTEQYLALRKEGYMNDGLSVPNQSTAAANNNYDLTIWDQNRFTDWQEVLVGGTARYNDAQFRVSGGDSKTQFLVGTGYHKETTVFPGDFDDSKVSLQFNINHSSSNQKLKLQLGGTYVIDNNRIPGADISLQAVRIAPNAPALYNEDGSLNWEPLSNGISTWSNPLALLKGFYQNKANNLIANGLISYSILPGLTIKSSFGYNNFQSNETSTNPLENKRPEVRATSTRGAAYANGYSSSWIFEPQAIYRLETGKGDFEAMIGSSFQQSDKNRQQVDGSGHSSDLLLRDIRSAATITAQSSLASTYKYNALFGRLNYNWQNKYILNLTTRRDGSSRFGSENLFNSFWSLAGAWLFSKEKFMSNLSFLSFGKLRMSYGTSGNDQIGEYGYMNLYNAVSAGVSYQGIPALAPSKHTNPYLQWEETRKLQFGVDIGFINDRVQLNVNYYHNRSSNLLVDTRLSIITGFNEISENFKGIVQNSGWEIGVNTVNVQSRDFNWNTSFNLTIPRHNGYLLSFPNLANTAYSNTYVVGKSLLDARSYHFLGLDPATGKYQFMDRNGNLTFTPTIADRTAFKNTSQRLYGGIQNAITYKSFELSFLLQFVKKNAQIFISAFGEPGQFDGLGNAGNGSVLILHRWRKNGDQSLVQRASATAPSAIFTPASRFRQSDGSLTDASFARLATLSFSWNLPEIWTKTVKMRNARIFVQGQNLFTITNYKGLDPATGSSTTLPPLRVVTFGGQVDF